MAEWRGPTPVMGRLTPSMWEGNRIRTRMKTFIASVAGIRLMMASLVGEHPVIASLAGASLMMASLADIPR